MADEGESSDNAVDQRRVSHCHVSSSAFLSCIPLSAGFENGITPRGFVAEISQGHGIRALEHPLNT